jgi:hypothetical protein
MGPNWQLAILAIGQWEIGNWKLAANIWYMVHAQTLTRAQARHPQLSLPHHASLILILHFPSHSSSTHTRRPSGSFYLLCPLVPTWPSSPGQPGASCELASACARRPGTAPCWPPARAQAGRWPRGRATHSAPARHGRLTRSLTRFFGSPQPQLTTARYLCVCCSCRQARVCSVIQSRSLWGMQQMASCSSIGSQEFRLVSNACMS